MHPIGAASQEQAAAGLGGGEPVNLADVIGAEARPHLAATFVQRCADRPAPRAAVIFPVDAMALAGALHAHRAGVVDAHLIGPHAEMLAVAARAGLTLDGLGITDAVNEERALQVAADAVRQGQVDLLVKGSGHSGSLLRAVLQAGDGARSGRRASHVFVLSVPRWPRLLFLTDAVVNIAPDLADKADICRNAIDLARVLGIATPRVAILSAEEDVETSMPATLHAAALSQMGRRGQLGPAIVDGPLALDDALDAGALALKGIDSPVEGEADVLVVPTVEAGNILYKSLVVLGGATAAGLVVRTPVPVVLASRSDSVETRLASTALGAIWVARALPAGGNPPGRPDG